MTPPGIVIYAVPISSSPNSSSSSPKPSPSCLFCVCRRHHYHDKLSKRIMFRIFIENGIFVALSLTARGIEPLLASRRCCLLFCVQSIGEHSPIGGQSDPATKPSWNARSFFFTWVWSHSCGGGVFRQPPLASEKEQKNNWRDRTPIEATRHCYLRSSNKKRISVR